MSDAAWLAEPLATIAFCWRVERRDGVAIGMTSHDRDLTINGLVHRASPGMTPSAIKRELGLDASTMDVGAALTSDAITVTDLLDGRWDGARVTLFAVDWTDPDRRQALTEGTIGTVETSDDAFTAELTGAVAALERPVVEQTSAECRATLGDARCRVPMARRRRLARIVAAAGSRLTLDVGESSVNAYGYGRLRWIGGGNSALEEMIVASHGADVVLRRAPRYPPAAGTLVELTEGCDRTIATCAGRFANAVNFRGEPFLPGIDLLTRYPGA